MDVVVIWVIREEGIFSEIPKKLVDGEIAGGALICPSSGSHTVQSMLWRSQGYNCAIDVWA
jgi:hypothetical protein